MKYRSTHRHQELLDGEHTVCCTALGQHETLETRPQSFGTGCLPSSCSYPVDSIYKCTYKLQPTFINIDAPKTMPNLAHDDISAFINNLTPSKPAITYVSSLFSSKKCYTGLVLFTVRELINLCLATGSLDVGWMYLFNTLTSSSSSQTLLKWCKEQVNWLPEYR